jgi:hypothetical protein
MRQIYLSIDLDYWRHAEVFRGEREVLRFFRRVFSLDTTIAVAVHHHHLLEHINSCHDLTEVVNVDFHSDLADMSDTLDVNEGSWANFVRDRSRMTFTWRYPGSECITSSYGVAPGYCHLGQNPFEVPEATDWRRVRMRHGLARVPWSRVCAVGVCLSPGWIGDLSTIYYPMDKLHLYEWYARWQESAEAYGHNDCMRVGEVKGEKKAKIRLHRSCFVV